MLTKTQIGDLFKLQKTCVSLVHKNLQEQTVHPLSRTAGFSQ